MIPKCIKLEKRQIELLNKWVKTLDKKKLQDSFEEDASCASPITFEVYSTGLGDNIVAKFGKQSSINLSIGDDNELLAKL